MDKGAKTVIPFLLASLLMFSFLTVSSAQDQVEIPSWEVGWETNMDGVYELELSGADDILDSVDFFVTNDRMGDLNLQISIEWDESDNIPIELEYDESVTVGASENQTFTIEISDVSGYSFERSPTSSMTLLLTAEEVAFDQALSTQTIDAELSVPSVFALTLNSESKGETLFSGSSIEYLLSVTNSGNVKDVIKNPSASIKSCPSVSVEGLEIMSDAEVENSTTSDFTIRIVASQSQPERLCEITISIKSAGNSELSSTVFELNVQSNKAEDDDDDTTLGENNQDDGVTDVTEADTLNFLSIFEMIFIAFFATLFRSRNRC